MTSGLPSQIYVHLFCRIQITLFLFVSNCLTYFIYIFTVNCIGDHVSGTCNISIVWAAMWWSQRAQDAVSQEMSFISLLDTIWLCWTWGLPAARTHLACSSLQSHSLTPSLTNRSTQLPLVSLHIHTLPECTHICIFVMPGHGHKL